MRRYSRTKNSTKIFLAVVIAIAIIFGITQFFYCCDYSQDVVAKVNGKKIYKSQVEHKLSLLLGGMPGQDADLPEIDSLPQEVLTILSKEIYFDQELTKIAEDSDAVKSDKVKNNIKESKNRILRQAYTDSLIKEQTTEEKISQKYSELSVELASKKEYELAHIVVENEKKIKRIYKDIKRRYSRFSTAAKRYSLDKESASSGGDLGFVLESNLIKEIADEIVNLKKNEVSKPIKTKFGWHLVKFTKIRDAKALPFEDVKDNIRQQLVKEVLDNTKEEVLKDVEVKILIETKSDDKILEEKSEEIKDASKKSKKK